MYLMYGDEADLAQGDKAFIVCGAIFLDADRAKALHDAVEEARREAHFASFDSLKLGTNTKPANCSQETHPAQKTRVLEKAEESRFPPQDGTWAPGYYSVLFEDPDGIRLEMCFVPGAGVLEAGVSFDPKDGYGGGGGGEGGGGE